MRVIHPVLCTVVLCFFSFVGVSLTPGDIMFIAADADGQDGFAILALVDIPANTIIHFNDNEWNGFAIGFGGSFDGTSESEMTWDTGATILSAGTIILFESTQVTGDATVNHGVLVSGAMSIAGTNEVIYAFEGSDNVTPTQFLTAIGNDGFGANGTLDNTGLTAGTNAIAITGDEDVMIYTGSTTCNTTVADCAANIADASEWMTEDGSGDQSNDGSGIEFPSSVASSFSGSALPIELSKFTAAYRSEDIIVQWETISEINNGSSHKSGVE